MLLPGRDFFPCAWVHDEYQYAAREEYADFVEWLGLDALGDPAALVLVEWPERGTGALPAPDLTLHLAHAQHGRDARAEAGSPRGEAVIARLGEG